MKGFNDFCRDLMLGADIFGVVCELEFEKKRKYNTILGGVFSIIIIALTLSLVVTLGEVLIMKNVPRTNISKYYIPYAPKLDLIKMDLRFGFGFYLKNITQFDDPSYFTFSANQYIFDKKTEPTGKLSMPMIELDYCYKYPERFVSELYNFTLDANKLQMDKFYCFKNLSGNAEGSFLRDYFENIEIKIVRCVNATSKVICKSKEEIDNTIFGGYFQFHYVNRYFTPTNYSNPMKDHFDKFFTVLDTSSIRFIDLYFKSVNITTDSGYVFEDKSTGTFLNFDYAREQIQVSNNTNTIIDFYINSSVNFEDISRSYLKLTELLATTGGILNVCLVIGGFITSFFSIVQMKIKMLNTLFYFDSFDIDRNLDHTNKLSIKKLREEALVSKINKSIEVAKKAKREVCDNGKLV